ncbi:MAG: ATP-binding cassette domain-containing protein [Paracoccaceae bacterium]
MTDVFKSLTVQQVEVRRDGECLLGPLDFTLESQGITAILGHNGAGKSLLLHLIHGQFAESKGKVLWNGKPARSTRRTRSLMFQTIPLMRRSVAANVEFPLIAQGIPHTERAIRVNEALKIARLSRNPAIPAASLSGGEKQRMSLARALVTRPQVVLLDEPSASLDPASTKELESSLREVANSGVKVLIATHDLMQARRLADDVLVFAEGDLLVQQGAVTFFASTHDGPVGDFLEGRL